MRQDRWEECKWWIENVAHYDDETPAADRNQPPPRPPTPPRRDLADELDDDGDGDDMKFVTIVKIGVIFTHKSLLFCQRICSYLRNISPPL